MREMGKVIFRRNALFGSGRSSNEVAVVARNRARRARGRLERGSVTNGVVALIWAIVPNDFESLAALNRGPGIARNHRDAAKRIEFRCAWRRFDLYDPNHAGHLEGCGG